jgi:hypothetical protein
VVGIGGVAGEVLAFAGAGDQQRLHAHQVDPLTLALVGDDAPAVPGRLTAHHDAGNAVPGRGGLGPTEGIVQVPGVAGDHAAGKHPRVMIAQRQGLAGVGQVDGQDRQVVAHHPAHADEPGVATRIAARQAVTLGHGHPPVWLGHQARSPQQGDVPSFNPSRSY